MAKIHSFPQNERTEAWSRERAQVLATSDAFSVRSPAPGVAQLSFGAMSVNLTLDALHDLTYELAAFVAMQEGDEDYRAALMAEEAASLSPRSNAKSTSGSSSDDA